MKFHSWQRLLVLSITLISLSFSSYSQEVIQYNGPIILHEYPGTVTLGYKLTGEDSVLEGPITFYSSGLENLQEEQAAIVSIEGQYVNGLPGGNWRFHIGAYRAGEQTTLINDHYQVDLTGSRHVATGNMREGRPDGEWVQQVEMLKNSRVEEVPFKSVIRFDVGVPQRTFRIENENVTLAGRFLRDGLAHDDWELFGMDGPMERWRFSDGRLLEITTGENRTYKIFSEPLQNPVSIRLNARYMELIALRQRMEQPGDSVFKSDMFTLLAANTRYYQAIESIFSELGGKTFEPAFLVRVPHYPIEDTEALRLDSIRKLTTKSVELLANLRDDTQLQLMQLANDEVAFLFTVLDELENDYLEPLEELISYEDLQILEFVRREKLLNYLNLNRDVPQTVSVTVSEQDAARTFRGPQVAAIEGTATETDPALRLARFTWLSMDSVSQIIGVRLLQRQREQQLAALEEELILASNQLEAHADTLASQLTGPVSASIRNVERAAQENLKAYSNDPGETPVRRAQELITCFERMDELILVVARQPDQQEVIMDAYTDEVWNPFTYTVMEEEIKKRILTAYRDVLLPYFFGQMDSELNCARAETLIYQLEAVHKRMYELIQEDTRRLERKLKREKDPEVVLSLFGITTSKQDTP